MIFPESDFWPPPILKLDNIFLSFGGTPLLAGANLQVEPGDKICLVGRNGSGKSTLLKIAAGIAEAQSGEVFRHPSSTVRYLEQAPDFAAFKTVQAYAEAGLGPGDDPYRVAYLLSHLGLTGEEDPNSLSGGEARRAALARVLAPEPDILLLGEPTNHLDLPTIEWLEGELQKSRSALVLISHDRRFLEKVSTATVWLDRGTSRRLDRGFGHFEAWRDQVLEAEELEQHKLGKAIEREEHWLRYGVTARRKRNMRRLGELQTMRSQYRGHKGPQGTVQATASDAQESGKLVIEAEKIKKTFGDRLIVAPFSIRVHRGDCIGLVGPNGAGKTTLLKMLTGQLSPDSGTVKLGTNLEIATLDQKREDLNPEDTLANYLTDGRGENLLVNGEQRHVTGYMKEFLFQPEQARTPIKNLSGGERARLMLARILSRPTNLLILDEPTNDLDIETLDLLQEIVVGFPGTVILVSHDRDFLDRTVTSTIAPAVPDAPDGRWIEYAGGYSDMLAQRKGAMEERRKAEKAAEKPKGEATQASEAPKAKGKLSFKQKFALDNLPKEMAKAEAEIAKREEKMADPNLFTKDPAAFNKLAAEMEKLRDSLTTMEEEWLELEMLREELEG
ncbi:ABC-F family ATP-binding cassette domain-containing protein [Rhizobium sp. P32RR-XVIII]|uniref:ABC-F family ATP-binding cassette domain-containing protein n=1 Tax=Rhizobium sp. P32RR-XVIII TaxID=2726738 RepID=UPI0014566E5A|nr:ABC-F family ATP-binding cassette domain-containing protein [Rhizobium sp. P32RR-XVIII]NLS05763.1 ABC-F family ATP-binding cassette domain-containing protein [Rhizobium sp. P32RR-XVIII]